MLIKKTSEADVVQICQLAELVRMDPHNPDTEKIKQGFLVYPLDGVGYRKRLNPFFTVAYQDDQLAGFLMCYERDFLTNLVCRNLISHEDGITRFLMERKSPFVYGDQVVVDPQFQRSGVGKKLVEGIFKRMMAIQIFNMFVALLHYPVQNMSSINFAISLGFRPVVEVRNQDGLEFGMYHLDLLSAFPKMNAPKRMEQVDEFSLPNSR